MLIQNTLAYALFRGLLCRTIYANVATLHLVQILEQETAFEVVVRVDDGVELTRW
jgi:hypothetical protein